MDSNEELSGDKDRLLRSYSLDDVIPFNYRSNRPKRQTRVLAGISLALAISNVILLLAYSAVSSSTRSKTGLQDLSYFGSPRTALVPFSHDWEDVEPERPNGYRYRDEVWDTIFPPGGGSVALSSDFVKRYDIPANAAPTDEDPDKGIYLIAGYHQLHCLSVVRDAIYYLNGTLPVWPDESGFLWDHVLHCIEAVRLGLTCFLDPTLINLNETWPGIPNGQEHVCRNKDVMDAFATEHAHAIPVDPRSHR